MVEHRQLQRRSQFPHQLQKVLLDANDCDLNFKMMYVAIKNCYHRFAKLREEKRLIEMHLPVIQSLFPNGFRLNRFVDSGMLLKPGLSRYSLLD